MYKLIFTFLSIVFTTCTFAQVKNIDFEKMKECRILININYKDREKDFNEAQNFKDVEIILIKATKDGKVKSFERGFVSTLVKNDYKGTFFQSTESKNLNQQVAQFPLFNDKNIYCYNAKCFDETISK